MAVDSFPPSTDDSSRNGQRSALPSMPAFPRIKRFQPRKWSEMLMFTLIVIFQKPFLVHSMEIIKKYGDFPVVVHVSRVKEESLTHRLSLKNSLSFSKYLAETVTTFIEEKMDFLPDVITLVETSRSALERDHLERILKKAG